MLREANPPRRSAPVTSLTKAEFSAVMAAARRDIRAARDRIRGNRELLEDLASKAGLAVRLVRQESRAAAEVAMDFQLLELGA